RRGRLARVRPRGRCHRAGAAGPGRPGPDRARLAPCLAGHERHAMDHRSDRVRARRAVRRARSGRAAVPDASGVAAGTRCGTALTSATVQAQRETALAITEQRALNLLDGNLYARDDLDEVYRRLRDEQPAYWDPV